MAKISAKNATILINGNKFSTYTTAYEVEQSINPIEGTGFSDLVRNYIPGLQTAKINTTMLWSSTADAVHDALKTSGQTGIVTIVPETYALGIPSITLPYMQSTYKPAGAVDGILEIGSIDFESYGNNYGIENGVMLYQGAITDTTTGTSYDNSAATTGGYSAVLHIWEKTASDTYVIKIQHSTDNSTWTDAVTFTADGTTITAERKTGTSINQYRRIVATRTGSGDTLGLSIALFTY